MKNLIPTVVALIFSTGLIGQINIEDSTVQVIGYWDMNETWSASRIHESGWVIYSIETKKVVAEGTTQINERIIEIL